MAKRLTSVFTDDMDTCIFTGSPYIERHHIFSGNPNRKLSEQYGFVVPLRHDLHPNGVAANPKYAADIDKYLKQKAQTYFENHYGSREEFINIFGKSWL